MNLSRRQFLKATVAVPVVAAIPVPFVLLEDIDIAAELLRRLNADDPIWYDKPTLHPTYLDTSWRTRRHLDRENWRTVWLEEPEYLR